MKRRIYIEVDTDEDMNGMVKDITELVMSRIDANVEFTIKQEILPERISGGIQMPEFMNGNRVISQQEKGMLEALHGRE